MPAATDRPTESSLPAPTSPGHGLRGRPIVLASDGSPPSQAATRVAAALGHERGALPHVVRALDVSSWPVPAPVPFMVNIASTLLGGEVESQHAEALRGELAAELSEQPAWPVDVETGPTARVVLRSAERLEAALVLIGLRRHRPLDRVARDETALHVMAEARCPVLGVVPELRTLPRSVVVGIDFGDASLRAARAALDVVAPGGRLLLAYARPPLTALASEDDGEARVHAAGIRASFEQLVSELANDLGVTLEPVVLDAVVIDGGPAGELLRYAEQVGADLLAVGSRRHSLAERWLLGSVTRDLAREGKRSLLVVPPARGADGR